MAIKELIEIIRNPFFIQEASSLDVDLDYLYVLYEEYIESVFRFINLPEIDLKFLSVDWMDLDHGILVTRFNEGDPFVRAGQLITFGRELEQNGTYWPFILEGREIIEGFHRAFALKAVESRKKWPCICIPDRNFELSSRVRLGFIFPEKYKLLPKGADKVKNLLFEVTVDNWADARSILVLFSMYFSKLVMKYRNEFIPSKILNDEETLKEWRRIRKCV